MRKYAFVILHYMDLDCTIQCVNCILESMHEYGDYGIVIVDNGSPNATGKILKSKFEYYEIIEVLCLKNNVGFAKGNNVGFDFAKQIWKSDFICLLNNDVLISQKDFWKKVTYYYDQYHCAVIGPQVKLKNEKYEIIRKSLESTCFFRRVRMILKIEYILISMGINILPIIKSFQSIFKRQANTDSELENGIKEDIVLHGCCWIFTPSYICLYDGLDDRTFLYREEELLALRLRKANLHSLYVPDIEVFHLEDQATNMMHSDDKERALFILKNEINSLNILIQEMG